MLVFFLFCKNILKGCYIIDKPTIKVCDVLMGSGKSSAAITYMNENQDKKFIYVAPYIGEVERIRKACPELDFPKLIDGIKHKMAYGLIDQNKNLAITHSLFKDICENINILDKIKEKEYVLIIDEALDVFNAIDEDSSDIEYLIKTEHLDTITGSDEKEVFYKNKDVIHSLSKYKEFFVRLKHNDILKSIDQHGKVSYQWMLTLNCLLSFSEVYILTYLFEGSMMWCSLCLSNLKYEKIGVKKHNEWLYRFCDEIQDSTEYGKEIKSKIHVIDNEKLNRIGNDRNALSINWIRNGDGEKIDQLRRNTENYFQHIAPCKVDDRMWGCSKGQIKKNKSGTDNKRHKGDIREKLSGRGYAKSFLIFNARATNEFKNKKVLAYTLNVFMHTGQKNALRQRGIEPKEQTYALSTLVQWVWRSAIRDGEEITIYIPSYRMRTLFERWLNAISTDGDLSVLEEKIPRLEGFK